MSWQRWIVMVSLLVLAAVAANHAPVALSAGPADEVELDAVSKPPASGPAVLRVSLKDESGLPPPGSVGSRGVSIPLELRTPDGVLVAETLSTEAGYAEFTVPPGEYVLRYGGPLPDGSAVPKVPLMAQAVQLKSGVNTFARVVPIITVHTHEHGGPFEFDYLDLDPAMAGLQRVLTVDAGSRVSVEAAWWVLSTVNWPVWYVSLFGDWAPTTALANLEQGCASPSAEEHHVVRATFRAPVRPGTYRVRLVGVLDYTWPPSFYTGQHFSQVMGRDMGVMVLGKGNGVDWGEVTLVVRSRIDDLIASVRVANIKNPHKKRLLSELEVARVALQAGKAEQAVQYLKIFIDDVQALAARRIIPPELAESLINQAQAIINNLEEKEPI